MRAPRHLHRWLTAVALVAAVTGCARQAHWRRDFGLANHTFFDRQAQAATSGQATGLDSEEAAIIHEHYRETLGKQGNPARNDPGSSVMILRGEPTDDRGKR